MNDEGNDRGEILRRMGPYLSLGTMFVAALLLGVWLGHKADGWLGTEPWLTLTGSLLGLAVGFVHFFTVVLRNPPG